MSSHCKIVLNFTIERELDEWLKFFIIRFRATASKKP